MKIGVSSFAFGWAVGRATPPMDETALLDFTRAHGLSIMQLADNLPVHEFSDERLAALTARARQSGVTLELGARGLTDTHLEHHVQLCAPCDCRLLRFVVDLGSYEPPVREVRALLRNAAPALEAAGVTLAIENHDRLPARALRDLIDRIASPRVGICLDTANSLGAGEGLEYVTELLAPVTVNLHVKDVAIVRLPHHQGFLVEGRPLGTGQLPIRETLARVGAFGRCQSAVLENWISPADQLETTIRNEHESAALGVETLKAWI